ncbi:MAG: class I SAM-dependent DNA methyltransferase [Leptothrix sp. (in: b-proteobacteria)]
MTPREFITKWSAGGPAYKLNERAGAQSHFIDMCRVLDVEEPGDAERYCFERGLTKTGAARQGYADVWLRGHFAWEYKAPGKDLGAALQQLMMYALPLESPPLLVVSDRLRIEIHTHFTGTPSECQVFRLEDLADDKTRVKLKALWQAPERFRPQRTSREITEAAAQTFAATATRLREAGVAPHKASHFLTQCLFCFFAEDVGLLPSRLFERMVGARISPERLRSQLQLLMTTMRDGGLFGVDDIPYFNGGLFRDVEVPVLTAEDVTALQAASSLDWSAIDPSIFGTLFERGLDPSKRSQLGAHYTDPATILRLIDPVVKRPLLAEWATRRELIATALTRSKKHGDKAYRDAQAAFIGFLERLRTFRALDPACGSGNFLYLTLKALKDIEHQVNLDAEALGLERQHDVTGPHNVLGVEINEFAAELARVTVWIGELQWRIQHGYAFNTQPVLNTLDHIECRDALMNADGTEAIWPTIDAIVGNPPFVGDKKMRAELGDDYTERLRATYKGRVPGGADLVCYWFEKARAMIEAGQLQRAGFVSTNSVRGGKNREVLDRICASTRIFEAWGDEPWVNNGAAVRVSLTAFGHSTGDALLDGQAVASIAADLSASKEDGSALDLTQAGDLSENSLCTFNGIQKTGPFDIEGSEARQWLALPTNPNGKSNAAVLAPYRNGMDMTRRSRDVWVLDFGWEMPEAEAALFEAPFGYAEQTIKPVRQENTVEALRRDWWRLWRPRPEMRRRIDRLARYIVTPEVSKHRVFAWLTPPVLPDKNLVVMARADDATFGILHSRFHELWSLRLGTSLEDRPRYTPTTTFETFPFPPGLTPADTAHQRTEAASDGVLIPADLPAATRPLAEAIARAAKRLNDLRERWLNPPEWCDRVPEVVPLGMDRSPYPDRIVAKPGHEKELAKRTLTNLYNERPAWLVKAHADLDAAVAAAYGWTDGATLTDDEILRRLLALNRERAAKT